MSHPPPDPRDPTDRVVRPDGSGVNVGAAIRRHLYEQQLDWLANDDIRAIARRIAAETGEEPQPAAVESVATFFPHYRREPPPRVELRVCRDLPCWLRGAADTFETLRETFPPSERVAITEVSCLGRCDRAPAACGSRFVPNDPRPVRDHLYLGRTAEELRDAVGELLAGGVPRHDTDRAHLGAPPYHLTHGPDGTRFIPFTRAAAFLDAVLPSPERDDARAARGAELIRSLAEADLRGMGGPGLPAWQKWADVAQAQTAGTKYVVANADESEPGTFKDRDLLLAAPELVVEGVILAGLAVGAGRGYVYVRHEYPEQVAAVQTAIAAAELAGVCGYNVRGAGFDFPVRVFVSPGGYICGEQTALIEAMEGKRAQPRNRPPELGTNGLFDQPTLLSNVETLAWAAAVARHDFAWYRSPPAAPSGWRLFSVSGDVVRPGVYEFPVGGTLGDLILRAGGVVGGEPELVAVGTSGPSGGFLAPVHRGQPARDIRLHPDVFRDLRGPLLGAGIIVYARRSFAGRTLVDAAVNATEFFARESCGKCVPCRVGTQKLVALGTDLRDRKLAPAAAKPLFAELKAVMAGASICGLGQVAPNPLVTALTFPAGS